MAKIKRAALQEIEKSLAPDSLDWLASWLQEDLPAGWFSIARWKKLKRDTQAALIAKFPETF